MPVRVVRLVLLCGVFMAAAMTAQADPQSDLEQLLKDYDAWTKAESPLAAGQDGDTEAARRLPSVTTQDLARRAAAESEFLNRVRAIPDDGLDTDGLLTRDLFEWSLENAVEGEAFNPHWTPFTNDSGFHTLIDFVARSTRLQTVSDVEALIARYRDLPRYLDENVAHLRDAIDAGWVQPPVVIRSVMDQMRAQIVEDARAHPLFDPFKGLEDRFPDGAGARLQAEAEAALVEAVMPAYAELLAFFETEYLPAARPGLGVASLEGGRAFYEYLARFHTTADLSPDEIHEIGLAEVARVRARMEEIIEEVGFEGSFEDFLTFLRTDDQFYAQSEEELLKEAAWIAKRTDDLMPQYFRTLARLPYGVRKVPDAIAPNYTTGRYWPGDADEGRAGGYMVNTYDLKARPLYELPALTLHEGVPGHHHQIALAQEQDQSDFRKGLYVTAFGEGWGLYAEYLGEEMGLYTTPYELFGRLSYEMWRACRLVVDTGIHWKGFTREEAEACFVENSALSLSNIRTEVDRYISWPGQALAYKIGEIKLRELRDRAEATLGDAFDVRDFHDAVLLDGTMPLNMLEARLDRWIADQSEAD